MQDRNEFGDDETGCLQPRKGGKRKRQEQIIPNFLSQGNVVLFYSTCNDMELEDFTQ